MKKILPFSDNKLIRHLRDFPYVWIFFLLLVVAALFAFRGHWDTAKGIGSAAVVLLVVLLLSKPMNAVYGLMGTIGSIQLFFGTFLLISILFAGIYQWGFFQEAGVSYDINQPHIAYSLYNGKVREPVTVRTAPQRDTVVIERIVEGAVAAEGTALDGREGAADGRWRETVITERTEELHYQPITFWFTWRNTILTALMQEPVEFFAVASTYNAAMDPEDGTLDRQKAETFQWLVIFQILISWIFFGVFISLLYSKFRSEL